MLLTSGFFAGKVGRTLYGITIGVLLGYIIESSPLILQPWSCETVSIY